LLAHRLQRVYEKADPRADFVFDRGSMDQKKSSSYPDSERKGRA
jgi:hypothetical protein